MIGDCVAWNPDKAPQVIVKNKMGNIGKLSGCQFDSVISGIVYSENNNAPPTPIVPINRIAPKYGYNFPMLLSIGNLVERIKQTNIMPIKTPSATFPRKTISRRDAGVVTNTVPTNNNNNKETAFTTCFDTLPRNFPASSGICAPLLRMEIIPVK